MNEYLDPRDLIPATFLFEENTYKYGACKMPTPYPKPTGEQRRIIKLIALGIREGRKMERERLAMGLIQKETIIEDEDGAPYPAKFLKDVAQAIKNGDV